MESDGEPILKVTRKAKRRKVQAMQINTRSYQFYTNNYLERIWEKYSRQYSSKKIKTFINNV